MAFSSVISLFLVLISFLIFIYRYQKRGTAIPTNWPVLGMIPTILVNMNRIHDYTSEVLIESGGTFLVKDFWFGNMDRLFTANPLDVHHILSKNFSNYPRGDKFLSIFDILGDGFSNTDGDLWNFHHKTIKSLLKSTSFQCLLEDTIWNKVESGLLPVLEYVSKQEVDIDLQDIFQRFAFDSICKLIFDYDPKSMSLDLPYIPCEKALSEIEEAIFFRYMMPPSFWKLQQLLQIGHEKKLSNAGKVVDQFIYKFLAQNQREFSKFNNEVVDENFKLSTALLRDYKGQCGTQGDPDKLLRDTLLNLMVAGRDTTSSTLSWFFYLLAKNPMVEDKIRQEVHTQLKMENDGKLKDLRSIELSKLVYLHGALSEALRLFPPVPSQHKTPLEPDILPSSHHIDKRIVVILSYYSMGRMKSIWGEDCMEFKPERWISEGGVIKHEPAYKFPAFNAGPRSCLGKNMSYIQMKILASSIIYHYHVDVVEGHLVHPSDSILLQMKNGLKVRLTKRSDVKM